MNTFELSDDYYHNIYNQDGSKNIYKSNNIAIIIANLKRYLVDVNSSLEEEKLKDINEAIMAGFIANEIIGVQPMTGPIDEINTLHTKEIVHAKTRKIGATKIFDTSVIFKEIISVIDDMIILFLENIPGIETLEYDENCLVDLIQQQAISIGQKTKRGTGNWCIVSPEKSKILVNSSLFKAIDSEYTEYYQTKLIGELNKTIKVYVNPYVKDTILVGYKGNDNDACAYYCPYIPGIVVGGLIDPVTFQPLYSFMTRYGFVILENSKNYLGLIKRTKSLKN